MEPVAQKHGFGTVLVTKRVAVAPFELKIGPNESYRRAASVGTPPGSRKAQIRANIAVKLPINRPVAAAMFYLSLKNPDLQKFRFPDLGIFVGIPI